MRDRPPHFRRTPFSPCISPHLDLPKTPKEENEGGKEEKEPKRRRRKTQATKHSSGARPHARHVYTCYCIFLPFLQTGKQRLGGKSCAQDSTGAKVNSGLETCALEWTCMNVIPQDKDIYPHLIVEENEPQSGQLAF